MDRENTIPFSSRASIVACGIFTPRAVDSSPTQRGVGTLHANGLAALVFG